MNPKRFFGELKRRNVYKVAIAYAVVGWLLTQVATQVFPFFEIPNWAVRFVVLAIIIGFPISLILAWAFEVTPEGVKRAEAADAVHERSRGVVWIYIIVVGAALSVSLFILGRYTAQRGASSETGARERMVLNQAIQQSIPEKSLAVLPFANLSGNPDNAYFAAGIQDKIITRLAKIGELKVVSCLSTQRFKSSPDDLPAIAKQLGVANADLGGIYTMLRRYDEAIQQLRSTLEIDPEFYWAHRYLGLTLELKGETTEAIAEYQKAYGLNDDATMLAFVAHAEANAGRPNEARQILARLTELAKTRYVPAYAFAVVHMALGEKDQALDWLEKNVHNHASPAINLIRLDPYLDPLRGEPRFQTLVFQVLSGSVK